MGCKSSKVGQKPPDKGVIAAKRGTHGLDDAMSGRPDNSEDEHTVTSTTKQESSLGVRCAEDADGPISCTRDRSILRNEEGYIFTDDSGLLIRTPRKPSDQCLHSATKDGDVARVSAILDNGNTLLKAPLIDHVNEVTPPYVDEPGMWKNTPLLVATQYGHASVAQALLSRGADPNSRNERQASALHYACAEGFVDIVRLLLKRGANPNCGAGNIYHPFVENERLLRLTPLLCASLGGHHDIASLLLDCGAVIDEDTTKSDLAQLERNNGEQRCENTDMTSLTGAASHGHSEMCRLLVDRGAKILRKDAAGCTCLVRATLGRHESLALELIDAARTTGEALELVQATVARGSYDGQIVAGMTPMHFACQKSLPRLVKAFRTAGAKVDTQNSEGATPLLCACQAGCYEAVDELLQGGADLSLRDSKGNSPFSVIEAGQRSEGDDEDILLVSDWEENDEADDGRWSISAPGENDSFQMTSNATSAVNESTLEAGISCADVDDNLFEDDEDEEDILLVGEYGSPPAEGVDTSNTVHHGKLPPLLHGSDSPIERGRAEEGMGRTYDVPCPTPVPDEERSVGHDEADMLRSSTYAKEAEARCPSSTAMLQQETCSAQSTEVTQVKQRQRSAPSLSSIPFITPGEQSSEASGDMTRMDGMDAKAGMSWTSSTLRLSPSLPQLSDDGAARARLTFQVAQDSVNSAVTYAVSATTFPASAG